MRRRREGGGAADLSCLLAAPLCLAGPTSPLLTLLVTCCQEAAPVHCTSFRIHLRLLFFVALLTSLQGGDNRLQEEQRCLLCWEAMGRVTVSDRTWNSATVEQTGERKKTMRSEVFPHPSCFHHVHKRIKTLQSYQSYEGSRKELSNS